MNLMGNHRQMRENLEPRKIAWQSTQKVAFVVLGKEDYLEDPEALYSPVSYFRKLFDDEITSNIVDYTNTYSLQCDPDETEQSFDFRRSQSLVTYNKITEIAEFVVNLYSQVSVDFTYTDEKKLDSQTV